MISAAADLPLAFARVMAAAAPADAWILLAPGRRRARAAAWACAAALLKTSLDPAAHPDCSVFDPKELGVDGLRVEHVAHRKEDVPSVESALRYKPIAGAFRAVLLIDADLMNHDAQGALLKTAEEPPTGTVLLLSGSNLGSFLPALRSRCRVVRLSPPADEELARAAAAAGLGEEEWDALRTALGGEAALELSHEQRAFVLERLAQWQAWRAGEDPAAAWLSEPEDGGRGAEMRALLQRWFQAALASFLTAAPLEERTQIWADRLDCALLDLEANLTPALILAELRRAAQAEG
jgi:hypothetical protein